MQPQQFGVRAKDLPDRETEGDYLRSFRPGDNTVRFCEEPTEWIAFFEHYNSENKSYPCTGDRDTCPGCNSENEKEAKATFRYASTVKLTERDVYVPMRIPTTVHKKMETRAARNNGTVLNRDYIVIKSGKGFDTEYDVEADRTYDISEKEIREHLFDIQNVLRSMYEDVWGKGDDQPAPKSEDTSQDEEVSEDDLRSMGVRDLRALARRHGVDSEICELGTKQELIDAIIDIAD